MCMQVCSVRAWKNNEKENCQYATLGIHVPEYVCVSRSPHYRHLTKKSIYNWLLEYCYNSQSYSAVACLSSYETLMDSQLNLLLPVSPASSVLCLCVCIWLCIQSWSFLPAHLTLKFSWHTWPFNRLPSRYSKDNGIGLVQLLKAGKNDEWKTTTEEDNKNNMRKTLRETKK